MNIIIRFPPISNIKIIRHWDDPVMMADGFSAFARPVNGEPVGQFALVTPYILRANVWIGSWSSNTNAYVLTDAQVQAVKAMQDQANLKQIWGWLTFGGADSWGAPLRVSVNGAIRMIAAVYANNPVEILERRDILCSFNGQADMVPMCRIKTGFSVIHNVTTVDKNNTFYNQTPVGVVKLPLYAGNDEWWLMERWLEAK